MQKTPVLIAIVVSILLHIAVGGTAMLVKGDPPGKRKKMVAVVAAEKKKAEPKKAPPPPPPPPPPKAVKAAPKPAPVEAPPPPAPVAHAPAHEAVLPSGGGLEMSNTGPGVDVGGETAKGPEHPQDAPKPQAVKKPQAVEKPKGDAEVAHDLGEGPAPCTEEATKPEPTAKTDIEYTDEARAAGVEGRLVLEVAVDENGAVTDVTVASSVDPALDAAAIAAVKQWRFKPSTKCGKPVAGHYKLARRFELGD